MDIVVPLRGSHVRASACKCVSGCLPRPPSSSSPSLLRACRAVVAQTPIKSYSPNARVCRSFKVHQSTAFISCRVFLVLASLARSPVRNLRLSRNARAQRFYRNTHTKMMCTHSLAHSSSSSSSSSSPVIVVVVVVGTFAVTARACIMHEFN